MADRIVDPEAEPPSCFSPVTVLIDCQEPAWTEFLTQFEQVITETVSSVIDHVRPQHKSFDVSLAFVGDRIIQSLNFEYRDKDKPTNVLSFPQIDYFSDVLDMPEPILLGDVVLAWETLNKEAVEQNKKLDHHVMHMLVHGTLHLLGYDHQNDVEAEEMEDLEVTILRKLNIPNPYK